MADIFSSKKRSEIMRSVRVKDTCIESITRKWLHAHGFRYVKNDKRLPGKPDIVLPKYKTVIFVHGCFWHGHDACKNNLPQTNSKFWSDKILKNVTRDMKNIKSLENMGWKVLTVWECELKNKDSAEKRLLYLKNEITDPWE